MFCNNCGTEIPDEANFCWKCGRPQKEGVKVEEPKYETCEIFYIIVHEGIFGNKSVFKAEAIGPKGKYNAGQTEIFSIDQMIFKSRHGVIHDGLISKLVKDGWDMLESIIGEFIKVRNLRFIE